VKSQFIIVEGIKVYFSEIKFVYLDRIRNLYILVKIDNSKNEFKSIPDELKDFLEEI
jgi:hypothetical protein